MPNYKTHSIHGQMIIKEVDLKTDINIEDFKSFCVGPDLLVLSDYKAFNETHSSKTGYYFYTLLNYIKNNKLLDNSEVISFLYGQIDHFILDSVMHPLIYYMTEGVNSNEHFLAEHSIDNYVCSKYHINDINYYNKDKIDDNNLKNTIDMLYKIVYGRKNESIKYDIGLKYIKLYDTYIRHSRLFERIGITYNNDYSKVINYLNLSKSKWYNPENNREYNLCFDDLWKKASEYFVIMINDINRFLYGDGILKNSFILNNISYNTGLPCEMGQTKKYIKKYR